MAITSSSTYDEVLTEYRDTLAYDIHDSVAECKRFIEAARTLIALCASAQAHGDESLSEDYKRYKEELTKGEAWWVANDAGATAGGGSMRALSVENWRR